MSVGIVSLPAVIQAEEKPSPLQTAVAGTTISGYVDTSAQWNIGHSGNNNLPLYTPNGAAGGTKADGFNLDVVELTISKATGDEPWSAGYNASLLFGPDAVGYNSSFMGGGNALGGNPDFGLKDTYVELTAPIGNQLHLKLGTFSSPLGSEVFEGANNPNYTRSYGYEIEPTQLTGGLLSYKFCDAFSASAGIANTWSAGVNTRANNNGPGFVNKPESFKAYVGDLALTAPTNWGSFSGSTLNAGVVSGWDVANQVDKTSFYVGASINTPITGVTVGVSYDYAMLGDNTISGVKRTGYQNATGIYLAYKATDKLSFNTRAEYFSQSDYLVTAAAFNNSGVPGSAFEFTETVQYDLWKNVISRVEFRWDHDASGARSFTTDGANNAFMVAANLIYKF